MKNKFMNLFTGRIHRLTFFFGIIVFGIVFSIIENIASSLLLETGIVGVIIYSIIAFIFTILFSGLFARRMRDINWTPHLAWLFGILWIAEVLDNISIGLISSIVYPVGIIVFVLVLIGWFKKGTQGENKNGSPQSKGFWASLINI